ncbi:hypothetical protein FFI11_016125 [Oerskovia sp. KBS0722]|nr:hypothetical protein FFI11_016125 [Oerskovia sp. KBS0722]
MGPRPAERTTDHGTGRHRTSARRAGTALGSCPPCGVPGWCRPCGRARRAPGGERRRRAGGGAGAHAVPP